MFNIKQYEKNNSTFIQSVSLKKLTSISSYSSEINGGFGKVKIQFALSVSNIEFEIGNFVHLQFKTNILIIGTIINVKKIYGKNQETLELEILGISSLTATLITNATYSDIASNILKDLVDNFNINYGDNILSYDTSSIPTTIGTLDLDFSSYTSYLSAMKEVAETAGLYLFIDNDGKVYLQEKDGFGTHTLTTGKDVDNIFINEDSKKLVNSLILKHGAGTTPYSDATSISSYGKRQKYINKSSELTTQSTADEFGNNYIAKFKDKSKKISIQVNNEYNFFSIKPGDLISVRNLNYEIEDLQAVKINYGLETCQIELEIFYSFANEIFNP